MECFQDLFMASKGQPVEYNGETIFMQDKIVVDVDFKFAVRLISTDSKYPQLINLAVEKGEYLTYVDTQRAQFSFLADTIPIGEEMLLIGHSKNKVLRVWNGWLSKDHLGNQVKESWYNGAAMKKEVSGNTIRYFCNDGEPDEDFNDLIFEITIL